MPAAIGPGGGIVFTTRAGWGDKLLDLPCGKCADCRAAKAEEWAVRCTHEARQHSHPDGSSNNSFLTLTYSDEGLAQRQKKEGTDPRTLSVRDWQLFAKRLRKTVGPFKFLMSAEYGEGAKRRPHYHALIFGQDFSNDRTLWRTKDGRTAFRSPTLEKLWPSGFHDIRPMVPANINYVCQYVRKKLDGPKGELDNERIDYQTGEVTTVLPPFALMSRGGRTGRGIGAAWIAKNAQDAFPTDFLIIDGKRKRVPRYYLEQTKKNDPDTAHKVRAKRAKAATKQQRPENYHQLMKNREVIQETQRTLSQRTAPNHIE